MLSCSITYSWFLFRVRFASVGKQIEHKIGNWSGEKEQSRSPTIGAGKVHNEKKDSRLQ